ncbi:aldose epimerase family protein [Galbibacter mesophilus]|uniref:aldose epimerase family protein n=1 Tax=Galbibacter mesophilus TaxID=379069 RepID=UPI00191F27FD|nr:aldose epimerase family protein [Galbibacter mesophilus]MCM5663395.1 galactose mutarotase [Galbibacter mesophilus]
MNLFKRSGAYLLAICAIFTLLQCNTKAKKSSNENSEDSSIISSSNFQISTAKFGTLPTGEEVTKYQLTNGNGMQVDVIDYGGIITHLKVPDRDGKLEDVVLGFSNLEDYLTPAPYFGAIIGRYGNRIKDGKFTLDGHLYTLAKNDDKNHLHGGNKGFDKVIWDVKPIKKDSSVSLQLSYKSADMEEGYPGNLDVRVTYTLDNTNALHVNYEATTDKKTIINLTQHSYFNLTGNFSESILNHEIMIDADAFLPIDETLIPTGEIKKVKNTPFDFKQPKAIGKEIDAVNEQLKRGLGYDHCWILNDQNQGQRLVATAFEPNSGRLLEIYSDQPGLQFYSGNFLDSTLPAKGGGKYAKRTGFALETQHYPDSPNQADFPSVILQPGEKYSTKTTFKFTTK